MSSTPLRYAISDRNASLERGLATPAEQVRLLTAEGVEFFQLREKDLQAGELAGLARQALRALAGTETRLLLNSRADVAVAVGAHGVHLPSSLEELSATEVHRLYAAADRAVPSVTISCHSLEDVSRVRREPLTAILFGPVFGKTVAGEQVAHGVGLDLLRDACRLAHPVPVLALGGVTEENAALCLEAGAAGIAGIRLFQRLRPNGATAPRPADSNGE